MRSRIPFVAALVVLSGCANDDAGNGSPNSRTTNAAATPKHARDRSLEAHLRKYLPLGLGSYHDHAFSVTVTDRVSIVTHSADPKFPYRAACQTALDLASEHSGLTAVEVRDIDYVLKSSSVGTGTCDKRYQA
jgi:hypothetical protein